MLPYLQRDVQQRKPEYNYCSHHAVVNLTTTKLERMLQPAHSPHPQPDIDCADCLALERVQAFSITALVHEVSTPRPVDKENRVVRDVIICDGSKIPRRDADTLVEAIVQPTLQIFSGTSDAPMIAELTAAAGKNVPHDVPRHSSQADRHWMESNFHGSLRHL